MADETVEFEDIPPAKNTRLIGHAGAAAALQEAANSGKLAHGWMFCGPKGIGKATLAHRFARYLLCGGKSGPTENGGAANAPGLFGDALPQTDPAPCAGGTAPLYVPDDDPAFHRITAGAHADLTTIERRVDPKTGKRANHIAVDDVREIQSFLHHTAGEGGWRVVIVDSACEMNRNAANALLKALEEPPVRTLMLLVCHNPGGILPTIRSRCRKMVLRPPSLADVGAYLVDRAPGLTQAQADALATLTDCSIGQSLDLMAIGGMDTVARIIQLIGSVPAGLPIDQMHELAGSLGQSGNEAQFETFSMVIRWALEETIRKKAGKSAANGAETYGELAGLAAAAPLDRWLEVWENVGRLLDDVVHLNLDRKQVVLNAFLELDHAVERPA
ncbi:MAG: DNA polymerase III subunit delta' [Rhodospirillaceae bacterium]